MKCYEFEVWYNVRLYSSWGDKKPLCRQINGSVFVNSEKEPQELLEYVKGNKHSYLHLRFVKVIDEKYNPLAKSEKEFIECAKWGPCMRTDLTLKCYVVHLFYEYDFFNDTEKVVSSSRYEKKCIYVSSYREREDLLQFINKNVEFDPYLHLRLERVLRDTSEGLSEEDLIEQLKSIRFAVPFR